MSKVVSLFGMLLAVVALAADINTAREESRDSLSSPELRSSAYVERRPVTVEPFDSVIPHIVDGASWQTSFFLTNLGSEVAYFAVFFLDNSGELMPLPLVGLGPSLRVTGKLESGQTVEFKTPGTSGTLLQGSAQMFALDRPAEDSNAKVVPSKIGGYAIFRQRVPGRPDFEAVAPLSSSFDTRFTIVFDNRDGYSTGVAIVNAGFSDSPVTVVARDLLGVHLTSDSFVLGPSEKRVFSVPERYPALARRVGVLQFSTTNDFLSGLGLRFSPGGAFTSAHSLSLPVF